MTQESRIKASGARTYPLRRERKFEYTPASRGGVSYHCGEFEYTPLLTAAPNGRSGPNQSTKAVLEAHRGRVTGFHRES